MRIAGWVLAVLGGLLAVAGLLEIVRGRGPIANNGAVLVIGLLGVAAGQTLIKKAQARR